MVEYNKYDDLKEQQHISNICDSVALSVDTLPPQTSSEHEPFIASTYAETRSGRRFLRAILVFAEKSNQIFDTFYLPSLCSKLTAQSARATTSSNAADNDTETPAAKHELPSSSAAAATRAAADSAIPSTSTQMSVDDDDVSKLWGHSMRPSPTYLRLAAASSKPRQK